MFAQFPILPQQASNIAGEVDHLFLFIFLVTSFFALLVAGTCNFFLEFVTGAQPVTRQRPATGLTISRSKSSGR